MDEIAPQGKAEAAEPRAALERQSQVRHDLRAPLAVMYPLLSLMLEGGELTEVQRDSSRPWTATCAARRDDRERGRQRLVRLQRRAGSARAGVVVRAGGGVHGGQRLRGYDGPVLEARVAAGAPAALVDRDRLLQIVDDLLDNAARFGPDAGPVTLSVQPGPDDATVALRVTDVGPGIPADEVSRVMEFGYRGSAARKLDAQGLGLGLWVCRRLAESMGGVVVVESAAGAGTTVSVILRGRRKRARAARSCPAVHAARPGMDALPHGRVDRPRSAGRGMPTTGGRPGRQPRRGTRIADTVRHQRLPPAHRRRPVVLLGRSSAHSIP